MVTERARGRGQIGPGYRILGVDPGTRILGYAVLELDRELRPQALRHGVCRLSSKETLPERLRRIFVALTGFVEQLDPDVVVVEDVFYGKNIQSAFRIGESRAVVLLVAALAEREIIEYSPATVKRAICGNGRAPKKQVQKTVERLLPLQESPETSDAADALAIALCHAQRLRAGRPRPLARKKRSGASRGITRKSLQALLERVQSSGDS